MNYFHSLNRSLGGAIAAIAAMALVSGFILYSSISELNAVTAARAHSYQIVRNLDSFRAAMLNQETGVRGYVLTQNPSSLEPYNIGLPALERSITALNELINNGPARNTEADELATAVAAARAWQKNIGGPIVADMAAPATMAAARQIESQGLGKNYFDTFRDKLNDVERTELATVAQQNKQLAQAERNAEIALAVSVAFIFLVCVIAGIVISRQVARPLTQLAEAMRLLAQRDLTVPVPGTQRRSEVGAMARAVEVFKRSMIELDRTSLLRATADTLPALVGYIDADRRVGFLNSEFGQWYDLHAGDVAHVYGRPMAEIFANNGFPGGTKQLDAAFAGQDTRFEHRLRHRASGMRDLEAFFRPHQAADGRILGVVTLLTDITERKRMERRMAQQARDLLRSNEELEQFAYVASHDLKAPLRGIDNLVTWIEEDLQDNLPGDTKTNMELLKSRVRRLESLLDDLLAYSRAGRSDTVTDTVDTRKLIDELSLLVSPPDGFTISGDAGLPIIVTPRAPLTQVLQNLIGNAIKHHDHPADGHIWVEAASRGTATDFTVTDDGPGIAPQFRERVFGMFQTLKPRDEVEGSGMGLAIVKKLVERQHGRIWLTEGRDGRGLAVHFTWPNGVREQDDGRDRPFTAG